MRARRIGPRSGDYLWRERIASDIRERQTERPLTEQEKATADKLEDEAAALRDLEREQGE